MSRNGNIHAVFFLSHQRNIHQCCCFQIQSNQCCRCQIYSKPMLPLSNIFQTNFVVAKYIPNQCCCIQIYSNQCRCCQIYSKPMVLLPNIFQTNVVATKCIPNQCGCCKIYFKPMLLLTNIFHNCGFILKKKRLLSRYKMQSPFQFQWCRNPFNSCYKTLLFYNQAIFHRN